CKKADGEAVPLPDRRRLKRDVSSRRRAKTRVRRLQIVPPLDANSSALKVSSGEVISKVIEAVVEPLVTGGNHASNQQLIPMDREAKTRGPDKHELTAGGDVPIR